MVDYDALIRGHEAALLAGVSKQVIRKWRKRKRNPLTVADHDADGNPLFRVRDVLDVDRSVRRSPWAKRGTPQLTPG